MPGILRSMHSDARRLRHELRNLVNCMQLAVAALELATERNEQVEWLDSIIECTDDAVRACDEYEPFQKD